MKSRKPSIPYIIWMVVFTMIPIIMIGFTAFTDKNGNFSFQAFTNAFYYTNIFVKNPISKLKITPRVVNKSMRETPITMSGLMIGMFDAF